MKKQSWVNVPVVYSRDAGAQERAPQFTAWRPAKDTSIEASFLKYNVNYALPKISPAEYQFIENFDQKSGNNWSRAETEYLLDLLQTFHGNFLLTFDRFDESRFGNKRTVEDLKERVYLTFRLTKTAASELEDVFYDKQNEHIRKLRTERYMQRNQIIYKKEEDLLTLIKDTTTKISKKEKEEAGIRAMLDLTTGGDFENIITLDDRPLPPIEQILKEYEAKPSAEGDAKKANKFLAFNRSSLMTFTVPGVSGVLNKKLKVSLQKMGLDAQKAANQENHDFFDRLKKEFIRLFVLKAYYEKKAKELENLENIQKTKMELLSKRPML